MVQSNPYSISCDTSDDDRHNIERKLILHHSIIQISHTKSDFNIWKNLCIKWNMKSKWIIKSKHTGKSFQIKEFHCTKYYKPYAHKDLHIHHTSPTISIVYMTYQISNNTNTTNYNHQRGILFHGKKTNSVKKYVYQLSMKLRCYKV